MPERFRLRAFAINTSVRFFSAGMRPAMIDSEPGCSGKDALARFIKDVVTHQADRMSQFYRMRKNDHHIVKDKPAVEKVDGRQVTIPNQNTPVILGYMSPEDSVMFRAKKYFYCRAMDSQGKPARLNLAMSSGALLVGYQGGYQKRHSVDWCAEISKCEFVTANQLKGRTGHSPSIESSHYLLFHLEEPWRIPVKNLTVVAPWAGGLAEQTIWLEVAKAPLA